MEILQQKADVLTELINNPEVLKQFLGVVSCYFTYLSNLTYRRRKLFLDEWKQIPTLSGVMNEGRIKMRNITYLFELIREEDFIISEEDEEYYENMTILLESIKPVIINDPKGRGRRWLKSFDASFATVSEATADFFEKLKQYLSNGHNILVEITEQETIDTIQTNYINSLIFLSEDTPTV